MKRLIKSSKFWLAVIGSIFSVAAFKLTNEISLSYWILGAFIGGIVGTAGEDIADKVKTLIGTRPDDR